MDKKLMIQALLKFTMGVLATMALLFWPAGTWSYWNGWLLMGILFVPMFLAGIVMLIKSPELLRSRLQSKENQSVQKAVILLSLMMFVGGFLLCGFNFRYQWHTLPKGVVLGAAVVFLLAYAMEMEVMRENAYLSRIIEVQENQKVVDTGIYGVVRHPMYAATVLLFLSMPLVLGSLPGFLVFLVYPFLLVGRIKNEEKVLEQELSGYREYKQKVKYRLLPWVW